MTKAVNIYTSDYDVYIGRAGKGRYGYFGNPFRLRASETRGETIERYRKYFYDRLETDPEFKRRVYELKDKVLGCFCKPYPCHGDVIAEYLNIVSGRRILMKFRNCRAKSGREVTLSTTDSLSEQIICENSWNGSAFGYVYKSVVIVCSHCMANGVMLE